MPRSITALGALQQAELLVEFDQLVGRAAAIAVGLGALDVGIVELARQPACDEAVRLLPVFRRSPGSLPERLMRFRLRRKSRRSSAAPRRPSGCARCPRGCRDRPRRAARRARCRGSIRGSRSPPPPDRRARGRCTAASRRSPSAMPDSRVLIVAHRFGRHDQPVDRAAIVLRQFEVQAGERRHRAAGAEQAQRAARARIAGRGDALGERGEAVRHRAPHPRIAAAARRARRLVGVRAARFRSARRRPTARSASRGCAAPRSPLSISTSSVEPPPMSKIIAGPSPCSSRMWQPSTASRASSCAVMMSSTMPVSSAHALDEVARRWSRGGRPRWRPSGRGGRCGGAACRRRCASAPSARSIASSDRRPLCARPSPSRTTRLNASMTVKLSPEGRAISRRQLLVPRSIAA